MKERLLKIRAPKPISNRWVCVIWSVLFLLFGAALAFLIAPIVPFAG